MRKRTLEEYESRLLKVQMYIQRHLDRNLELDELAKVACFSPFHFHRIFGALVGESLKEYIRRLRLERSAAMLFYGDRGVSEIASLIGYDNNQSFSRAFKEHFGVSPRDYRKLRKQRQIHPPPDCVDAYVFKLRREGSEPYEVKVEDFPERTVAFVRHIGPYHECITAWEKLCSQPGIQTYLKSGSMIGIAYDDPAVTSHEKIRYDACVEIDQNCPVLDGIGKQKLPGGKYAVIMHRGPYEGLYAAGQYFFREWLPDSGCELRPSPIYDIYYNCAKDVPPEELLTALCFPIK